jgi:hypothetical protein
MVFTIDFQLVKTILTHNLYLILVFASGKISQQNPHAGVGAAIDPFYLTTMV